MYTENFCVTRKNIDESILFHFPIGFLKFTYSEKATKFCEIFPLFLTVCTVVKSKGEDFTKFCGLLRKYELYRSWNRKL